MINEHATVVSLLDAVRLLDQPLRCAFLDVACANDAELRGQVELLLTAVAVRDDCLEPLGPGRGADDGAAESMLSPGQVLKNRYEIEGQHGAGGQGVVYRAFDRVLSRRVVIKVMRAVPAYNAPLKARFEDEMRALSRIDHPSVLGILDVDALPDGAPFLILPFVDGVSVRQLVEQGSVDTSRTVGLIRAIGAALSAVHAAGVAHHDLKPENIIVQSLGGGTETIKLIDFGLAKVDRVDVSSDLTTVMIAGTVRYMAPEQFDGRNTKAADIYALGLVACELLCGHPDVRALPRRTPVKVRRLLERAVAYAPEARPSDAKAWADALASQLSRRWRLLAPIPAAITAVILGGIGLLSSTAVRSTASGLNGYHFTPVATDGEPETGAVWSRDGHSIAYTKMVAGTWQVCVRSTDSDTPVQLTRLAADASSLFWWPDGSRVGFLSDGMAWSVGRAGGLPEPVQHNGGIAADLSPDGGTLAMWRVDKESAATSGLWLASPPTAGARKYEAGFEKPGGYNPVHLRFSPDGAKILISFYAPDAQVWLVPSPRPGAAHEAPRHLFATTNFVDPPWVSWMPDSRRAVISFGPPSDTHGLWIADTESDALDRLPIGPTDEDAPSVAPDGKRLAFTANLENYDVVAIPFDGSPIRDLAATSRSECCAAWVPGTATFVYVTNSGGSPEIRIHDPGDRSDRVVASTRDFRRNAASAQLDMGAVSPDGERVAFLEYSSSGFAIWITPIAGGAPVRLTRSADPQESGPSWSPDGEWISFLAKDGGIPMLMRSRVGSADAPQVILRGGRDESKTWCCVPEWSPTGEWIAFVSDKGIKLVTPDGTRQRLLSSMTPHALAWSHDGARLYVLAVGTDRRTAVESIDLMSGSATTIRTFNPDVVFTTPQNPGVRASLAADGRSLLTTALRTRSDIWMLEGFDRPRGMLDRFRPSWSQ